jgi:hypothetical protein
MKFIADTLAVGIAGLAALWRREVLDMLAGIGGPGKSTGIREWRAPAATACDDA